MREHPNENGQDADEAVWDPRPHVGSHGGESATEVDAATASRRKGDDDTLVEALAQGRSQRQAGPEAGWGRRSTRWVTGLLAARAAPISDRSCLPATTRSYKG